jgi:Uma2 family endonuclease
MTDPAQRRMTLEEFLAFDDGTDRRFELIDGAVVAMAPPNPEHGAVVINLGAEIRARLRPPCRVVGEAGIVVGDRADTYFQADLAVSCAPPDRAARALAEPRLIVEVLSRSTASHDRGTKLDAYRSIASVEAIALVHADQRRVELWRRDGPRWIVEDLIGDAELVLPLLAEPIPLAGIYENVEV